MTVWLQERHWAQTWMTSNSLALSPARTRRGASTRRRSKLVAVRFAGLAGGVVAPVEGSISVESPRRGLRGVVDPCGSSASVWRICSRSRCFLARRERFSRRALCSRNSAYSPSYWVRKASSCLSQSATSTAWGFGSPKYWRTPSTVVSIARKDASRPETSSSTSATMWAILAAAAAATATRRASTPGAWVVASLDKTPRSFAAASRSWRSWSMASEIVPRDWPLRTALRSSEGISCFNVDDDTSAWRTTNCKSVRMPEFPAFVVLVVWSFARALRRTPTFWPRSDPWFAKFVTANTNFKIFFRPPEFRIAEATRSKLAIAVDSSAARSPTVAYSHRAWTLALGLRARSSKPTISCERPSYSCFNTASWALSLRHFVWSSRRPARTAACSMWTTSSFRERRFHNVPKRGSFPTKTRSSGSNDATAATHSSFDVRIDP
mmetsp:Transcript_5020/g.16452  ORF Transcript_5020/g.16452 Transcript_5020/m.16452 type:complete len:437 (-) Transcript_5020:49-1359(-)